MPQSVKPYVKCMTYGIGILIVNVCTIVTWDGFACGCSVAVDVSVTMSVTTRSCKCECDYGCDADDDYDVFIKSDEL